MRTIPTSIETSCNALNEAWARFAPRLLVNGGVAIPDTEEHLNEHAFLAHSIDMQGFRAGEFTGVDPLTRKGDFQSLNKRGIGVRELATLWDSESIRKHLLKIQVGTPLSATVDVLTAHGGETGRSLAEAFETFPWRKGHWSVRAYLQNSAALKPYGYSFRNWLERKSSALGAPQFPPADFRRRVQGVRGETTLEYALRQVLQQEFYMVGPAMSAYMLCDYQLWLWQEALTATFDNFKLDSFQEGFVNRYGGGAVPKDESGFVDWWHAYYPDLPPRLVNACIWLAIEHRLFPLGR